MTLTRSGSPVPVPRRLTRPVRAAPVVYRGPDRRNLRRQEPRPPTLHAVALAVAVAAVVCGLSLPVLAAGGTVPQANQLLQMLAGTVIFMGGGCWLVVWRLNGRARAGYLGAGLFALGIMTVTDGVIHLADGPGPPGGFAAGRAAAALVGSMLLLRGGYATEADSALRPIRLAAWSATVGVAAVLAGRVLVDGLFRASGGGSSLDAWLDAATALLWTVVAATALARNGRLGVTAMLAAPLATSEWIRALRPGSHRMAAAAAAFTALAAGAALASSALRARAVLADSHNDLRGLRRNLELTSDAMRQERAEVEERLHDLRNAIIGIRAADLALQEAPGGGGRLRLRESITAELARLESTLTGLQPADASPSFDPLVAMAAVVEVERAGGADIELAGDRAIRVRGDAAGFATVIQNLLVNARRYAPERPVRITAAAGPDPDSVVICVEDGGPGIPPNEAEAVFRRGRRGSTAAGTAGDGLGLHNSRVIITRMGGTITVRTRADGASGACVAIRLPAAQHEDLEGV